MTDQVIEVTRRLESTAVNTFGGRSSPVVAEEGSGSVIVDPYGKRFIDLVCGSAVSNIGHGHPEHIRQIEKQLRTGVLHTGTRLPCATRSRLYAQIAEILPFQKPKIHLTNSGAEAIETALKAAQYTKGHRSIIAFEGGYHGRTLGALSITHNEKIRCPFKPLPEVVSFVPYPGSATGDKIGVDGASENSPESCVAALERQIQALKEQAMPVSAIVIEGVQGVSGVVEAGERFLAAVRDICTREDALFIVDEIWTGFGRTGHWFSFERYNIHPDLVVFGKGLSGGLPLAGVAGEEDVLGVWPAGMHTSTFQGNPLACAAANATIDVIRGDDLLAYVRDSVAPMLRRQLKKIENDPGITAVRTVGAMSGVQLNGTDSLSSAERASYVEDLAKQKGVLVYKGGAKGDVVMLVPPININLDLLEESLQVVLACIRDSAG